MALYTQEYYQICTVPSIWSRIITEAVGIVIVISSSPEVRETVYVSVFSRMSSSITDILRHSTPPSLSPDVKVTITENGSKSFAAKKMKCI